MVKSPSTRCDGCGREMAKAHARWDGLAYCATCYKRIFVTVPCQDCGQPVGVPKGIAEGQCKGCRSKGRLCVRCRKPTPRASLTIEGGVACASCARYFKPPQACPICGTLSLFLARDLKHGFTEPVCPSCRRKGYITCPGCRKHRRPAGVSASGQVLCSRCLAANGDAFICPQCGQPGRRYSARRCEACYWRDTAAQRLADTLVLLRGKWAKDMFSDFMGELLERVGPQQAALRLNRYFLFFARLDASFDKASAMTAERIAAMVGAEGLRRHAVPYGFLVKGGMVPPATDNGLQAVHELDRQRGLMARASGQWYEQLLLKFHDYLQTIAERYDRRGWHGERRRFLPSTITRNVRAAALFLGDITKWGVQAPQQILQLHLDRFIAERPGYRDGSRSFIRFLNRKERLFRRLKIVTVPRNLPPQMFLSQARYHELLRTWLGADDPQLKESLVCLLLLLYAQPVSRVVRLKLSDLLRDRSGIYRVRFGRVEIPLHEGVGRMLTRYLESRAALATMDDAWANAYLFTGRNSGSHLSAATVGCYLQRYAVTAQTVFSTALYQAYVSGARHPKVLVRAFGISPATASRYHDLIDPRFRAEIEAKTHHE